MATGQKRNMEAVIAANKRRRVLPECTKEMTLQALELIAAGDSQTAAAKKLGVTQPELSDAIGRHGLDHQYARAREKRGEALAEQCLEIVDNSTPQTWQQDRLRYDARKWFASKLYPKVYGDKVTQEVVGSGGGPLQVSNVDLRGLSDEELATMERILSKANKEKPS